MAKMFWIYNGEQAVKRTTKGNLEVYIRPTNAQINWLQQGLDQAGGKLPLFDKQGQKISARTIN